MATSVLSRDNRIGYQSIKEAIDKLPNGICFFSDKGLVVLCNHMMYRLAFRISGRDLQSVGELREMLANPIEGIRHEVDGSKTVIRLPDGQVWNFSETVIEDDSGTKYTQFIANNVTELHQLSAELEERNRELESMLAQFKRVSMNMADITRQEEILSAKMWLHNKMGSCVLQTQYYFRDDVGSGSKEELIDVWEDMLISLEEELVEEDNNDIVEELLRVARSCGVNIDIVGEFPRDDKIVYLMVVAVRECLTNTIKHAGGHHMEVRIEYDNGYVTTTITNDGKQPEGAITPHGGLKSLKRRIEEARGSISIQSMPELTVTVRLPEVYFGNSIGI